MPHWDIVTQGLVQCLPQVLVGLRRPLARRVCVTVFLPPYQPLQRNKHFRQVL